MRQSGIAHDQRCLLAADAACAVAHHRPVMQGVPMGLQRSREVAEPGQAPVQRALEGANIHLEGIACVQHHHRTPLVAAPLGQPARQGARLHGRGAAFCRPHCRPVHADDLALDLDLEPTKGHLLAEAALDGQAGKALVRLQPAQEDSQAHLRTGQGEVQALLGDKDGAQKAGSTGLLPDGVTQPARVLHGHETVGTDVQHGVHGGADSRRRSCPGHLPTIG